MKNKAKEQQSTDKPIIAFLYHQQFMTGLKEFEDEGPYFIRRIIAEEIVLQNSDPAILYRGQALRQLADLFVPYFVIDSTPTDKFMMSVCRSIEMNRFPTLNNWELIYLCGDKYLSILSASTLGIRTPKTILIQPQETRVENIIETVERTFSTPFIIKPRGLLRASGIFKIETTEQLISVLQMYERAGLSCLVQEYIDCSGKDLRLYFVRNELTFAYTRKNHTGFISNSARRNSVENHSVTKIKLNTIPAKVVSDSLNFLSTLHCDFSTVDWFENENGFFFNESESLPGTTMLKPDDSAKLKMLLAEIAIQKNNK